MLFYAPISLVLYPMVSKLWDENRTSEVKTYLEYSTKLFTTLAIPAAAGIAMLSQPLLKILTTSEFLAGRDMVLLLAVGTIFLGIYQINGYIVLLVKKTKFLPVMTAASALTSLVLNIILIPRIGIIGAAISNIASYFVLAIIVTLWARKTINYSLDVKLLAKVIFSTLVMAACLYFLNVHGVLGIILAVIAGAAVFGICLILLRAFSEKDKRLIRKILSGFVPGYIKK
jgi:O-antigen/teichoic acid export membrane protein